MAILDHSKIYKERLLEQYKTSTNLIGLIDALIGGQGDLELVLDQLLTERGINTAVGKQLDIIGEIVGQKRVLVDVSGLEVFGYQGAAGAIGGYGSNSDLSLGARYAGANDEFGAFRELGDYEYRYFIKSKIFKNVGSLTRECLISAFKFILGDDAKIVITEVGNHNVAITIMANLPKSLIQLLVDKDILPRPAGVNYSITLTLGDGLTFAFAGFPGGSTFGDDNNPTIGGLFT